MSKRILMTTGSGDNQIKYVMEERENKIFTDNKISYDLLAIGKYDLPVACCVLNVDIGSHTKEKPASYEIKQYYFNAPKICKFDEFVCNVFDCVEKFIQEREFGYCKLFGNFAYSKEISQKLMAENYVQKEKAIQKDIYVPYIKTSEQKVNMYFLSDEENENAL